ncbi:HK97-gp10 family putative phage morphogenesis protein [Brevundimonas subvibrioides]|uniref:HK97-gp10 family putative phage morphogenesis protein n=1 Tax=Brevundimonas subvibrioides TaxID=74313 RepID=UPI0022B45451|nr:HK97-gp10 family putative phage morphogenesis protein [Brevundimonas subvibrioides]
MAKVRPLTPAARAQLKKDFEAIPERMRHAAKKLIDETAARIVDQMKLGSPDGEGALDASIRAEDISTESWLRVRVSAGGPLTTRQTASGRPYDYARAIEYGTSDTPPQPFFRPVRDRERKKFNARLRNTLKKAAQDS